MSTLKEILRHGLTEMGLARDDSVLDRLELFSQRLLETNQVMNLTAITEPTEVAQLHLLDSAAVLLCKNIPGARVIDVGTGAGFPGLPIKLLEPSLDLTLFDSLQKRLDFLSGVCRELALTGVLCLHGRAEEAGHDPALREQFDVAVSRAVARLDLLCELCLPFVSPQGRFLAMKAEDSQPELEAALPVAERLGGRLENTLSYTIPGTEIRRRIYVFRKETPTPETFPRRWAKLKKIYGAT